MWKGENVHFFREREGNVLFGGRNVFLAGEKRVKSLVEREKCSFFQRDRGIFSVLERWGGRKVPLSLERNRECFLGKEEGMFSWKGRGNVFLERKRECFLGKEEGMFSCKGRGEVFL